MSLKSKDVNKQMYKCSKCGFEFDTSVCYEDDIRFCIKCGMKVAHREDSDGEWYYCDACGDRTQLEDEISLCCCCDRNLCDDCAGSFDHDGNCSNCRESAIELYKDLLEEFNADHLSLETLKQHVNARIGSWS